MLWPGRREVEGRSHGPDESTRTPAGQVVARQFRIARILRSASICIKSQESRLGMG
jgi:hypothetical protein